MKPTKKMKPKKIKIENPLILLAGSLNEKEAEDILKIIQTNRVQSRARRRSISLDRHPRVLEGIQEMLELTGIFGNQHS